MTLALAQLFHLGNARSRLPVLRPQRVLANPYALAALALVLVLQVLTVSWAPLRGLLRLAPMNGTEWGVVLLLSLVPAVAGQLLSWLRARRPQRRQAEGGSDEAPAAGARR